MTCPKCGGSGWIDDGGSLAPYGDTVAAVPGMVEACPLCNPEGEEREDDL